MALDLSILDGDKKSTLITIINDNIELSKKIEAVKVLLKSVGISQEEIDKLDESDLILNNKDNIYEMDTNFIARNEIFHHGIEYVVELG